MNYVFSEKKLEEIADARMPIHVVEKKIPYMDETGNFVKPEVSNGYKFETLVLDKDYIEFLKLLDAKYPKEDKIRLVLDNFKVHSSEETRKYLATVPGRFEFVLYIAGSINSMK